MPDANPCLTCGACCGFFRVSFYWGECASAGGVVPDELTTQVSPTLAAMCGTESKPARCTALLGEIGQQVSCSIYAQRSSTCREFEAAWYEGVPNDRCNDARAFHGLPPLFPDQPVLIASDAPAAVLLDTLPGPAAAVLAALAEPDPFEPPQQPN